jgi:hypothetical protein
MRRLDYINDCRPLPIRKFYDSLIFPFTICCFSLIGPNPKIRKFLSELLAERQLVKVTSLQIETPAPFICLRNF